MRATARPILPLFCGLLILILPLQSIGKPGDPSLSVLADRALVAGDLPLAVELYERWLEADPSDYVSWYNFACTQALVGDTAAALQALENALIAGWTDSTWTMADPDLVLLRGNDRFKTLMSRMGRKAALASETAEEGEQLYFPRTTLDPCLIIRPETATHRSPQGYPLVMLLHDRGEDMEQMKDLVDRLALPGVIYAIPRAPYPVEEARGGFEYWPREIVMTGDSKVEEHIRSMTADYYGNLVGEIVRVEDVDTNCVVIIGYAQGGAAALLSALEAPEHFLAIATLAGYLPETRRDTDRFVKMKANGTHLFIAHGAKDREVTKSEAATIRELADSAGVETTCRIYPAEHDISDEMVLDLSEWLSDLFAQDGESHQP